MSQRGARLVANLMIAAVILLVLASVRLSFGRQLTGQDSADWFYQAFSVAGAAIYLWIGRAIVSRQPGNTIGWLLLAIPTLAIFALTNGSYATRALVVSPGALPFGQASAWVDRWLIVLTMAAFIPLFLLYPDGHLPSKRWRAIGILTFAAPAVTALAFAVTPGRLTGSLSSLTSTRVTNPFGIEGAADAIDVITQVGSMLILVSAVASLVAIVVRYRRAGAEVRQQIRWLAFVGLAFFTVLVAAVVINALGFETDALGNALFTLMFLILVIGIPVACGVAILKYRLYQLDVVVRKSLVFAVLAGFVAVAYAAIVGSVGLVVQSQNSAVPSFVAAAALAVIFQPARERARRLADRLVYGKRATPYEVLSEFSGRMGETFATEDVLPRMAQILAEGTGAQAATVWLLVAGELRPEASWPGERSLGPRGIAEDAIPDLDEPAVEVRHQGELLGALSVTMPPTDPIGPAKEALIRDLASQAGLVLRNVRLIEELRASRQRLVSAQDEERRKLERNLHDGAQQQLVALAVQLRLAKGFVKKDSAKAEDILESLEAATHDALEDLRDLARGIYPPLLADKGIAVALESQARKATIPVEVHADGIGRYARETEATMYFCVLEALNNVAKYSQASTVTIRLAQQNGHLEFSVTDDGIGFDQHTTRYGTGLQGMADRLDAVAGSLQIRSAPGEGATITGTLPVRELEGG